MAKVRIEIDEEVNSASDMVDLLNDIATKVKEGHTIGHKPSWALFGASSEVKLRGPITTDNSTALGAVKRHE